MCELSAKCKQAPEFKVVHKAVGAMPERSVAACRNCAEKVGKGTPSGPLLHTESRDSKFYRIEDM